jgi:hypothetical protein
MKSSSRRFWIELLNPRRNAMAAKGMSFAEKWSRWGVTVSNVKEHAQEMPYISDDVAQLEQMLAQVRDLGSQQEGLRGQVRELNAKLRDLTKAGEKLRSRLGASLQGKLGFTSEALVKFGFKPRRLPRRTPAAAKKPPVTPPSTTPGHLESKPPGGSA